MPELKNFRSNWEGGELTGWSCEACSWERPVGESPVNVSGIGMALTAYLEHACTHRAGDATSVLEEAAA